MGVKLKPVRDPDIEVAVHRAPRVEPTGEVELATAAVGDRYVP